MCDVIIYERFTYVHKDQKNLRQRRHSFGGGIMLWGMIMPNGLIAVRVLQGKQNSDSYITLFKEFAVPLMKLNSIKGYSIVHDNCSIHVSRTFQEYAKTQEFQIREWPSRSPDLNIMENVWKMISDSVYSGDQPLNKSQLYEKIVMAVLDINRNRTLVTRALHTDYRCRLTKLLLCKGNIIT